MMKKSTEYILILFACITVSMPAQTQVNIGTLEPAGRAAILQLENFERPDPYTPGQANANKGLLLPRVELNNKTHMPFAGVSNLTELTGTIVYNIKPSTEMEKGIYEWDGAKWYYLETVSDITGSTSKKSKTTEITANLQTNWGTCPLIELGIFQFRLARPFFNNAIGEPIGEGVAVPQVRLKYGNPAKTYPYHIATFWDYNDMGVLSISNDYKINAVPANSTSPQHPVAEDSTYQNVVGYSYNSLSQQFNPVNPVNYYDMNSWTNLYDEYPTGGRPNFTYKWDYRFELWLIDPDNNRVYNVHFFIACDEIKNDVFAVIGTEY
ncbi:MAG: hypothetical protein LBS54_05220 [Dysgonamonadaceae bacterium]|jgi:hypothetical protein|nr:hypothetical protein [Dysgonamonadaceae bacterium]